MSVEWHDVLGAIGVALVLGAYFLLQTGRLRAEALSYSLANGIGAALVVLSLCFEFNLAAFLLEGAWVVISGIGIVRWWSRARGSRQRTTAVRDR